MRHCGMHKYELMFHMASVFIFFDIFVLSNLPARLPGGNIVDSLAVSRVLKYVQLVRLSIQP